MVMRERILEKAEELFIRYGIKRITMDEIAARLGISKKTIYLSFADKNELVSKIFDKHIISSQQDCLNNSENAKNAVHEVLMGLEAFCITMQSMNPNVLYDLEKYHPDVFKRFTEFKNQFLYTCILQNLKRGIKEEMYRKDMDPEIITKLRLANILLAMDIELFPAHQFRPADIEREIVAHFLNGIVTPKGALEIRKHSHPLSTEKTVLA